MNEQSNDLTEQEIEQLIADLKLTNPPHTFVNTNPLTTTVIDVMKGLRAAQAENEALKECNDNAVKRILELEKYNAELIEGGKKVINDSTELADMYDQLLVQNKQFHDGWEKANNQAKALVEMNDIHIATIKDLQADVNNKLDRQLVYWLIFRLSALIVICITLIEIFGK